MNLGATIIGQSLAFAIFAVFCMKVVWPPMMRALEERKQRIAEGLSAADRAQRDLEIAQQKVSGDLEEAKVKAAEIIELANRRAAQIVEEAKGDARIEGERLIKNAQEEIDLEISRAREELRKAVSALVIGGAEKVLGSEINQQAHEKLLNELAAQL